MIHDGRQKVDGNVNSVATMSKQTTTNLGNKYKIITRIKNYLQTQMAQHCELFIYIVSTDTSR